MLKHLGPLLLSLICASNPVWASGNSAPHADYGWVPEYKKLFLRGGMDFFSSASNYDNTGNLISNNQNSELTRRYFFLQPEYGLAQDWSFGVKLGLISSTVNTAAGAPALSSSGFNDVNTSLKWMVRALDPIFTVEAVVVIPSAQAVPATTTDVALGDGAFGAGLKLNTVHETGQFAIGFSPGFLYRSRGYSSQITGDAFMQFDFRRGYLRAFGNIVFPLTTVPLFDSSLTKHDVKGAAGSYALLSASPFGVSGGAKLGIKLYGELFVEAWYQRSFVGQRSPNFSQFGVGLFYALDFLETLPVKNVHDVPFDGDDSTFYKGK